MMKVPDNGLVTEYFIVDNFSLCLPLIYVHHKLSTAACLSHALWASWFFQISGKLFFLGDKLAIL